MGWLREDGAGLPSGSSEKGVQRDSGRGARPPCQPRGRVWSQCMPFLLDPVSPRSPWHPAAGCLAPASGQPRTGGGAASGALGGAAVAPSMPSAPPQGGAGTQAGCGLLAGRFRAPRPSLPLRVGGEVPGDAAGGEQAVRVVGACGGQRQQHVGRALGPRGDLRPRAQPGPCHRCHRAVLCQRAGGDRGQPAGPHFALTAGAAGPPPRPPETPLSSSLAVSGSGRRSRGAGPSAGWTSDWTSRPWRVVCLRWPWTAQDSASKPSLWPFPLTPPVLVPGQGHGGAGLGPDGGRDAQVGPRGLIARLPMTSVQVRPGESLRRPVAPCPAWRRASHSDPPPPTRRGAAE